MTGRRAQLRAKFRDAQARFAKANSKVAKLSQTRLSEWLNRPAAERLKAFEDPDLSIADRQKLRKSLRVDMRAPLFWSLNWRVSNAMRALRWWGLRRSVVIFYGFVIVTPLGAAGYLSWLNTARTIAIPNGISVEWRMPTGEVVQQRIAPGTRLDLIKNFDGSFLLRNWIPNQGYATAKVAVE
ncbi:hypothetical protein [Tardiphaga sp.]|jgi:hypothetical protein|uniref:hypothetical protein n=1 Tax=Tardiphaga sp. TaxID=1926292 RepID=UPI0037DA277D